jgi:FkbM family methyltransferase
VTTVPATSDRLHLVASSGRFAAWQARSIKLIGTAPLPRPVADRAAALLGRILPRDNRAVVVLPSGATFSFRLADRYWLRLILNGQPYEPELERLFEGTRAHLGLFLDGGANLGYWSVTASAHGIPTVAVEAAPHLWPGLARNKDLTRSGFEIVQAALWSRGGERLPFTTSPTRHAAGALAAVAVPGHIGGRTTTHEVVTVTIDELIDRYRPDGAVLIKLDVEGAELEVLEGAARTLARDDVITVFEEHGADPRHTVSRAFLDRGLTLYRPGGGSWVPLTSLDDLRRLKRNRRIGYNLVAVNGSGPARDLMDAAGLRSG